ncbi:MAG: hypothetical protein M3327_10175 [Actinomycetota bacterium]|nr:hypothetical protein [Actinomycetota bacterium]
MTITRNLSISEDEFLALQGEEAEALIAARYHALRDVGCDAEAAVAIAATPGISVGKAADLLQRGCDSHTVLRLLLSRNRPDTWGRRSAGSTPHIAR